MLPTASAAAAIPLPHGLFVEGHDREQRGLCGRHDQQGFWPSAEAGDDAGRPHVWGAGRGEC